jgi:hypothetical protein
VPHSVALLLYYFIKNQDINNRERTIFRKHKWVCLICGRVLREKVVLSDTMITFTM